MICDQLSPPDFLPTHETPHSRRRVANGGAGLNSFVGTSQTGFIGAAASAAAEAYYSTFLHELTHFTGHETRCNPRFGQRVGDGLRHEAACRRAWRSVPVRRSWNFSRAARRRVASGGIET